MNKNFSILNSIDISNNLKSKQKIKIEKNINNLHKNLNKLTSSLSVLKKKFKFGFNNKTVKKYDKFQEVAIIGMGGSILGAKAIYGIFKNKIKKNFYFFDNLDKNNLINFKKKKNLNKVFFIIISKSGNTLETLINMTFFYKFISKKNAIIICEKRNNKLANLSKILDIDILEHKKYIGGRYSVLSEVGMFPLSIMGLDFKKIRKNIVQHLYNENKKDLIDNVCKISNIYSLKKFNTLVLLNYSSELDDLLSWLQQLLAESLGKKGNGLLPIISQAPKDHHSLLQLYLDGPKDKVYYIFKTQNKYKIPINKNIIYKQLKIKKNSLDHVVDAQKKALTKIFKKKNIPFREIVIKNLKEETVGSLFSYFMLETVLVGDAINVNPYDQPAVEEIKILTNKYLN